MAQMLTNVQKGQMTVILMQFVKTRLSRTNAFASQVIKEKENNVKVRLAALLFLSNHPLFIYSASPSVNSGIPETINADLQLLILQSLYLLERSPCCFC